MLFIEAIEFALDLGRDLGFLDEDDVEDEGFLLYPFVGPRFSGILVKVHGSLFFSQLVQILVIELEDTSKTALHLTFFLLHSSQARETLDLFLGGSLLEPPVLEFSFSESLSLGLYMSSFSI